MIESRQTLTDHKVLVVIPTYNNAGTIADVITQVRLYADHILVVNDGSTDNTLSLIRPLGVEYLTYPSNRGKGYAIRQSFKFAIDNGYDYVLTIDSDGQHYASDIIGFAKQLDINPDSLIIGARNLRADNMPAKNTFANKFSNFWYHVETGQRLDDTQSGYRLYPMRKIGAMRFLSNRYEFEVEVIVRAAWKGIKVYNIPIRVYYPPQEERVSHFKPLKDFTRISVLNTFLVLISLLYYYPWRCLRLLTKSNIERFIKENITEIPDSNHTIAASIGLGIFFGIVPIWGYQMIVAALTAHLLKLNKVVTLVSSNISIPPMIPFILYGSFLTGAHLLGTDTALNIDSLTLEEVCKDLIQYILGAVVFASVCAVGAYTVALGLLVSFRHKRNG